MVIMEKINKKFFIDTQQKYVPKIKQNIFGLSGVDEKMHSQLTGYSVFYQKR